MVRYWAKSGKNYKAGKCVIGPFETREAALGSMYDRQADARPLPDYLARAPKNQILTGYGADGPYNDLRWHDAYSVSMAKSDLGI